MLVKLQLLAGRSIAIVQK